jgi:hypothetical protein
MFDIILGHNPPITHMKVEQLAKQLPMHKVKHDKMNGNWWSKFETFDVNMIYKLVMYK